MKLGVLVFPGSNCDYDCFHLAAEVLGAEAKMIWHEEAELNVDMVIVPGGFSYGDYLRCGAIAKFSKVMEALIKFADSGKPVIGICNGFQILTESGLLPGTLLRNQNMQFVCKDVYLKVASQQTPFTADLALGTVLKIPVAHGEGNYFCSADELAELKKQNQIVFQYCEADGKISAAANPNGALENIAGICNRRGNVLGMMPHPERCAEAVLGNQDGLQLFRFVAEKALPAT